MFLDFPATPVRFAWGGMGKRLVDEIILSTVAGWVLGIRVGKAREG